MKTPRIYPLDWEKSQKKVTFLKTAIRDALISNSIEKLEVLIEDFQKHRHLKDADIYLVGGRIVGPGGMLPENGRLRIGTSSGYRPLPGPPEFRGHISESGYFLHVFDHRPDTRLWRISPEFESFAVQPLPLHYRGKNVFWGNYPLTPLDKLNFGETGLLKVKIVDDNIQPGDLSEFVFELGWRGVLGRSHFGEGGEVAVSLYPGRYFWKLTSPESDRDESGTVWIRKRTTEVLNIRGRQGLTIQEE